MNILNYILPPLLGGIIALSTNWLAIKMLFRPHKAKYIFGLKIPFTPGLIPKERERLAKKIAEAISTRLLTPEVLAKELSDPSMWQLPDITIGEAIAPYETQLTDGLKNLTDKLLPWALEAIPNLPATHPKLDEALAGFTQKIIDENISKLAGLFVSKGKIYESIKTNLFEYLTNPENHEPIREKLHEIIDMLPRQESNILNINIRDFFGAQAGNKKHAVAYVLEIIATYLSKNMPIQTMIENKLASFDIAEAEDVILSVAGRELRLIIWLGGLLGFIIGCLMIVF